MILTHKATIKSNQDFLGVYGIFISTFLIPLLLIELFLVPINLKNIFFMVLEFIFIFQIVNSTQKRLMEEFELDTEKKTLSFKSYKDGSSKIISLNDILSVGIQINHNSSSISGMVISLGLPNGNTMKLWTNTRIDSDFNQNLLELLEKTPGPQKIYKKEASALILWIKLIGLQIFVFILFWLSVFVIFK